MKPGLGSDLRFSLGNALLVTCGYYREAELLSPLGRYHLALSKDVAICVSV